MGCSTSESKAGGCQRPPYAGKRRMAKESALGRPDSLDKGFLNRSKQPVLRRSSAPVLRSPAEGGEGGRKRRGFRRRDADGCDRDGRGRQRSGLQPGKRLAENSTGVLFSRKWPHGEGVLGGGGEAVGRVP